MCVVGPKLCTPSKVLYHTDESFFYTAREKPASITAELVVMLPRNICAPLYVIYKMKIPFNIKKKSDYPFRQNQLFRWNVLGTVCIYNNVCTLCSHE